MDDKLRPRRAPSWGYVVARQALLFTKPVQLKLNALQLEAAKLEVMAKRRHDLRTRQQIVAALRVLLNNLIESRRHLDQGAGALPTTVAGHSRVTDCRRAITTIQARIASAIAAMQATPPARHQRGTRRRRSDH